ncbi:MAG: surface-adhesin E family protein [Thermodesulfobacteriota bacterium]
MKNLLFLLIFIVLISNSCSRGWQNISEGTDAEGGKFILALDRSDIHGLEGTKTAWVRKTFEKPKTLKNGKTYQETYVYIAVNCRESKYSIIQIGMSNPGSSEFVHTVQFSEGSENLMWKDVPSDNISKKLYQELCTWYSAYF